MGKPIEHAESSVKKYGGNIYDYLDIHEFLDSSQSAVPDLRHRMLTHNAWFITTVMPKIFGSFIENADGKKIAVQSICEDHVFEDLERYPSAQDWANEIQWKDWMKNLKVKIDDKGIVDQFKNEYGKEMRKQIQDEIWDMYRKQNPRCILPYNPLDSCRSTRDDDAMKVTVIS